MKSLVNLIDEKQNQIVELYKQSYSISNVISTLELSSGARRHIETLLKAEGMYEGIGGKSALYKVKRAQDTFKARYGVINPGQLPGGGWKHNKVPKTQINFITDFKIYSDQVDIITQRNIKKMLPVEFCYYTGIRFIDSYQDVINPNDLLKRSCDHRISKWIGYMMDILPDNIGDISNLCYCLRYCNTLKSNMSEDQFRPLAAIIRERFINEGFESN